MKIKSGELLLWVLTYIFLKISDQSLQFMNKNEKSKEHILANEQKWKIKGTYAG